MENKFVFIAPMFNASVTLPRMLHSLAGQSYDNWKLILIDDVSSDEHWNASKNVLVAFDELLGQNKHGERFINFTRNTSKLWEVANVLYGINQCNDDDIICRIDADDWLCELDALAMIDAAYEQSGCDLLWTAHRWGFSDKNISGPMPDNANPYTHQWVSSHLKTFRKRLLNNVNDKNYRGQDGEYIKRTGDQAIYLPAMYHSSKKIFLPRVVYHYTIDDVPETYQTSDAKFQRDEALFLRARGYVP